MTPKSNQKLEEIKARNEHLRLMQQIENDKQIRMKALEIENRKIPDANQKVIDDRNERIMMFYVKICGGAALILIFLLLVYTGQFESVAKNLGLPMIATGIAGAIVKVVKETLSARGKMQSGAKHKLDL